MLRQPGDHGVLREVFHGSSREAMFDRCLSAIEANDLARWQQLILEEKLEFFWRISLGLDVALREPIQ